MFLILLGFLYFATSLNLQDAHASGMGGLDVGGVVLANLATLSVEGTGASGSATSASYSGKLTPSLGVTAEWKPRANLGVEADLFYLRRTYNVYQIFPAGKVDFDVTVPYLQVPILAHYAVLSYLDLGLGIYYARGMGDCHKSGAVFGATIDTTVSRELQGLGSDDFGAVASVRGHASINEKLEGIFELRYDYGLKNISNSALNIFWNEWTLLAGVRFKMME